MNQQWKILLKSELIYQIDQKVRRIFFQLNVIVYNFIIVETEDK